MLPSEMRNISDKYDSVVSRLEDLGLKVEEVCGVSDAYYEFIGCRKDPVPKGGPDWLFTGSSVSEFLSQAETFLSGYGLKNESK